MLKYLKPYLTVAKAKVFGYMLFIISSIVLRFIEPYLNAKFIDHIVYQSGLDLIGKSMLVVIIINLLGIVVSFFSELYVSKVKTTISFNMVSSMVDYIHQIPLLQVRKFDPAYLTSRISADVNTVLSFFLDNFVNVILAPLIMFTSLFILIKTSIFLAVITFFCIPIYLILYFTMKKPLAATRKEYIEKQNQFTGTLVEELSLIEDIKTEATFLAHTKKVKNIFENVFSSYVRALKVNVTFSSLHSIIALIFQLINLAYGGFQVAKGQLTIGEYTILNVYFFYVLNQIDFFLNLGKSYQNAKVSYDRLYELLALEQEHNGSILLKDIKKISLNSIAFMYPENLCPVIINITFEFSSGELYGIVGDNGSGKTTLLNIILGLIQEVSSGSVSYNYVLATDIDLYYIRQKFISVVRQASNYPKECIRTLLENRVNNWDNIERCICRWGLEQFYHNNQFELSDVLDKEIGELSGGEQQKLVLLFSLLKEPEVLILDEPTSALDQKSIDCLISFLHEYKKTHITICISHEKKVIDACDRTLCLPS